MKETRNKIIGIVVESLMPNSDLSDDSVNKEIDDILSNQLEEKNKEIDNLEERAEKSEILLEACRNANSNYSDENDELKKQCSEQKKRITDLEKGCDELIECYNKNGQLLSFDVNIIRQLLNK